MAERVLSTFEVLGFLPFSRLFFRFVKDLSFLWAGRFTTFGPSSFLFFLFWGLSLRFFCFVKPRFCLFICIIFILFLFFAIGFVLCFLWVSWLGWGAGVVHCCVKFFFFNLVFLYIYILVIGNIMNKSLFMQVEIAKNLLLFCETITILFIGVSNG